MGADRDMVALFKAELALRKDGKGEVVAVLSEDRIRLDCAEAFLAAEELGGKNDTLCHLDIPLRGCTLSLDGREIVRDGAMVPNELRVEGR